MADPEKLADRVDFSGIDLNKGFHLGQPVDQIATLLTGLAQQLSAGYLAPGWSARCWPPASSR